MVLHAADAVGADDLRQGIFAQGLMIVGTLGCFVRLSDNYGREGTTAH